ncbi:MAG: carboxymuconolactone decarboxylase family protein [Bryobacteraceae bacterium]
MRSFTIPALVGLAAILGAQQAAAPNPRDVKLVGDRFKPLTYDQMTPAQKTMLESLLSGERRGNAGGPFNVLLRSPEIGDLAQKLGAGVRFHSSLPPRLNELGIIITARFWSAQFEWNAHKRAALAAGISQATVDAITAGTRPTSMQPDEEAIYNFGTELLRTKQVSDATFQAATKIVGERGVVDLIAVMGYYQMVSMLLNVDRYPLGNGVQPELKPLP